MSVDSMADVEVDPDDTEARQRLKSMGEFVEQMLASRDRIVFDMEDHPLCLTASDLFDDAGAPLPGIRLGNAEEAWFGFQRLPELAPPSAPPELAPWLIPDPRPAPNRPPALLGNRDIEVDDEQATELIAAGLVVAEAIAPLQPGPGWALSLRPAELPDIARALDDYLSGAWRDWATAEAPRRRAKSLYDRLYKAHVDLASTADEGGGEVLVGIGIVCWRHDEQILRLPLIEQRAEFELDDTDATLWLMPRHLPPTPALSAFQQLDVREAAVLQRDLTARLEAIDRDPDVTFSPFHPPSFLGVLEACAARLDASGTVLAASEPLGPPTGVLRISPTFCILVRRRADDVLREDMRRLTGRMLTDPLPPVARRFVVDPPDALPDDLGLGAGSRHGVAGAHSPHDSAAIEPMRAGRERLYFPLPANPEQEEIARRLLQDGVHGVVVQGPPGTGKTHTIANIIGHSMASGQRVLVAAHTAEALRAIRDKLPKSLQDLVIAVIHSDRAGAQLLEEAVRALANRVQLIDVGATTRRIAELEQRIVSAEAEIVEIDATLAALARANETDYPWRGGVARPQAIAVWVAAQGRRHDWFPDQLDLIPEHEPLFDEAAAAEIRACRARLGPDIGAAADSILAGAALLPTVGAVVAAHRALRDHADRQAEARDQHLPQPDLGALSSADLDDLIAWLERLAAWRDGCTEHSWLPQAWQALASGRPAERWGGAALRPRLEQAALLAENGDALLLEALVLPEIDDADRLTEALTSLIAGRKPFSLIDGLRSNPARDAIAAARVAGEVPSSVAAWQKLAKLHAWRREQRRFTAQWVEFAARHGLPGLPPAPAASREAVRTLGRQAWAMLTLMSGIQVQIDRLAALFPYGVNAATVLHTIDIALPLAALRAHSGQAERAAANRLTANLREAGGRFGGELGEALLEWADGLGRPFPDCEVVEGWRAVLAEVDRLRGQCDDLRRVAAFAALVRRAGAPRWAEQIESNVSAPTASVLPADWRDAWDHARGRGLLARIADRAAGNRLAASRAEQVAARERQFQELIEQRTYLALRGRLTENVLSAIRKYLSALARMPKGAEAKTAARQRRIMRDSLGVAAAAVPCWIMPEWRVAEQLPPTLGNFDLVIIDEASQSNITALPVILRGRKLLVVGDDKQVSPSGIGFEEAAINRLRLTHLRGQPLEHQLDPATSLYELASMAFPGKEIMLREHFRCVEPIIRFSSQFYGNFLLPLRLPKPSERIDPPLVDIHVEDGTRRGDINEAEAAVIVREITAMIADPAINAAGKRSIGVISLYGRRQAKLIHDRLLAVLGPRTLSEHAVLCGDAATFQGQERDIVFLSMVHDERTARRETMRPFVQRANVALSRARDRMVLVRSLTASMLKDGDIKLKVLRHFQDPLAGGRICQTADVLADCDSRFERDVGTQLLAGGYRLRAQVPAGGYRIDFVVEGHNDKRLAIELDGDAFHGPERWAQDRRRQAALERLGWTFWRCWASEWYADQEAVFQDLLAALQSQDITPVGADLATGAPPVEFRSARHGAPVASSDVPAPISLSAADKSAEPEDRIVRIGDAVDLLYEKGTRLRRYRIAAAGTADRDGSIPAGSPLARAILGSRVGEEAEYETNQGMHRVMVVAIASAA